ncbi:MAG: cell division protein FtsQ/DivIB [Limnohabitans sp.]
MNKLQPLPVDVRLMNSTASLLYALLAVLVLSALLGWLARLPVFSIRAVMVDGEVLHHNAVTLRANVMPQLSGNFFTIDLQRTREVFESMPWVRLAVVKREFPDHLRVVLSEHQPVALWGDESGNAMVNRQGQVFEAEADDQEVQGLPRLKGPEGTSMQVLRMLGFLAPMLGKMDHRIDQLELTPRGSWRVLTHSGAQIELGRGTQEEIGQRLQKFWLTLSQVAARYERTPSSLEAADLRHIDGYALRLKGVRTLETPVRP